VGSVTVVNIYLRSTLGNGRQIQLRKARQCSYISVSANLLKKYEATINIPDIQ